MSQPEQVNNAIFPNKRWPKIEHITPSTMLSIYAVLFFVAGDTVESTRMVHCVIRRCGFLMVDTIWTWLGRNARIHHKSSHLRVALIHKTITCVVHLLTTIMRESPQTTAIRPTPLRAKAWKRLNIFHLNDAVMGP